MDAPAIRVRGLRHGYGEAEVLSGIDLDVAPGCVFGYIGPNGAGKTTTVRILTGQLDGFAGEVTVAGLDVAEHPREVKRRIGTVPENATLYEGLTALEFLEVVGHLRSMNPGAVDARAPALLEAFGLAARRHGALGSFSKGMKQKVLLASALLHDPEILFLDEPLTGLDVDSTILVKEILAALSARGRTIFYCSHVMDVVERVCDRIVILDGGRIAADGTYGELAEAEQGASLETVFSRLTGAGDVSARVALLVEALDT